MNKNKREVEIVIKGAKLVEIVKDFDFANKTNPEKLNKGLKIKILTMFSWDNEPELKERDLYLTVFNQLAVRELCKYDSRFCLLDFSCRMVYRKIKSNKFVDKMTGEPAEYGSWDFIVNKVEKAQE